MLRQVVVVAGALLSGVGCGGSTKALKAEGGAAGSAAVAGASSVTGGTGSVAGMGSGGGGASAVPGEAGQGGDLGVPLGAGIVPGALAGCRGPSDAGCEVCYFSTDDGRSCTRESGGARDYVDYVGLDGACPADTPRCAHCSYAAERDLRALGKRDECSCGTGDDTAPCPPNTASCGCYCNAHNASIRACPLLDN